MAMAVSSSG